MKVSIDISAEYKEPFAVIHTDKVTPEIQRAVDMLGTNETPVTAFRNEEDSTSFRSSWEASLCRYLRPHW